jgi:hypothetical protein
MLSMAAWVAGLFFWRFWRDSGDRLFAFFAFAFWVLTLHWFALGITNPGVESRHYVFLLRLLAFALIVLGIVVKNRNRSAS